MTGEVKQRGQLPWRAIGMTRIRQPGVGVPKFVEEGMAQCLHGGQALRRRILQESRDQINGLVGSSPEDLGSIQRLTQLVSCIDCVYLVERMWFDLGKFVLHVVRVHGTDLFPGGRA